MGNKNKNKNPRQQRETERREDDIVSGSSDEKSELYICIRQCFVDRDNESYAWYGIKLSWPSDTPSLMSVVPPNYMSVASAIITLNHVIYILGGDLGYDWPPVRHPSSEVYCLDTQHLNEGWKKAPSMSVARDGAFACVANGKICVFGGIDIAIGEEEDELEDERWSEVFDGERWQPNTTPSFEDLPYVFPIRWRWRDDVYPRHVIKDNATLQTMRMSPPMCIVGDVLYCYRGINVWAYHLVKHEWFSDPVLGLNRPDVLPHHHEIDAHLLYIGNRKICLVWSVDSSHGSYKVRIFYTIFSVEERPPHLDSREEGTFIVASIKSHTTHELDGLGCVHCLVL